VSTPYLADDVEKILSLRTSTETLPMVGLLHHNHNSHRFADIYQGSSIMAPKRSARAAKKIKRETAATETDVDAALQSRDTFEQVFGGYSDQSDDTSDESDGSYNGRKRKRSSNKRTRKQSKTRSRRLTLKKPHIPETRAADPMSDTEYDSELVDETQWLKHRPRTLPNSARQEKQVSDLAEASAAPVSTLAARRNQSTPTMLKIHVKAGAKNADSTINIDLTPLLEAYKTSTTLDLTHDNDETLLDDGNDADSAVALSSSAATPSLRERRLADAKARALNAQTDEKAKIGFTDLPQELRVRVYRLVFVTESPINFHTRKHFQRSSGLLRTCKIVHEEGRAVLYGENAFHFERSFNTRGRFFEEDWREIGFKDIRRFLETIGNTNLSLMRYMSFDFTDTNKTFGPVEELERRCVNDSVVWQCLELIGANTHLAKFAFQFSGRKSLDRSNVQFLRALTSIKSQVLVNVANYGGQYRLKPELFADLKKLMVVPRDDPDKIDETKKKPPTVIMHHERNRGTRFYAINCRLSS
jgi:hypothetical protein